MLSWAYNIKFRGYNGTMFNDIHDFTNFPDTANPEHTMYSYHPIIQIKISGGRVIDAISTTYLRTDGTNMTIDRGSKIPPGSPSWTVIGLGNWEIISQICGFSGMYPDYNQDLLIQLSLVITDTKTGAIRVVGAKTVLPRENSGVADPMCLAGFHTPGSTQAGISGLSIVKSGMAQ
ncbi:hypothetical protein B0H13DRAFT_2344335 [Mycena leptocephala]|nr:hypothetical protein B0H13DRAFT_2344335 [Mycena leptocephala]